MLGTHHIGGGDTTGEVRGLTVTATGQASWSWYGYDSGCIVFAVYLDGALVQTLDGTAPSTHLLLQPGEVYDVHIVAWSRVLAPPPSRWSTSHTHRAYIVWGAVSDAVKYTVYYSAAGVTYAAADTVEDMAATITGTTVALYGSSAGLSPATYVLTFTSTSTATLGDGTVIVFTPGVPSVIAGGMSAALIGTPTISETATITVAARTNWTSAVLTDGTHYYKISSTDAAGNESAPSSAVAVAIVNPPAPLTGVSFSYAPATDVVSITCTQSAAGASIAVYADYDASTNTHPDDMVLIYSGAQTASTTATTAVVDMTGAAPAGEYTFFARAVTAGGVDDGTATPYYITLPYVPVALPVPSNLTGTATANGTATLQWVAASATAQGWLITVDSVPGPVVTPAPTEYDGTLFRFSSFVGSDYFAGDGSHTIAVSAYDGTYYGTPATGTVITDETPPSTPTWVIASGI